MTSRGFIEQGLTMIDEFRSVNLGPMAGDDCANRRTQRLKLAQRAGVFLHIGFRHVPELLFQNGPTIRHFLFWEMDEDIGGSAMGPNKEFDRCPSAIQNRLNSLPSEGLTEDRDRPDCALEPWRTFRPMLPEEISGHLTCNVPGGGSASSQRCRQTIPGPEGGTLRRFGPIRRSSSV